MEKQDECCPRFDPKKWDKKIINWKDKLFIKDSMFTLFHIPFPWVIGKKILRLHKAIEKSKAFPKKDEWLLLFYDPNAFKSEMYMGTTKEIEGEINIRISGKFIARVFDGPYKAVPKFMKKMDEYLLQENKKAIKYYVHYAYCPKCSKKYGHNYMILFAKV